MLEDTEIVLVELQVVKGCPNEEPTRVLINAAAQDGGLDVVIRTVVVGSEAAAQALQFPGSPTIRLNGRDPFASPYLKVGLSCRVYQTAAGFRGTPDQAELLSAMLREDALWGFRLEPRS